MIRSALGISVLLLALGGRGVVSADDAIVFDVDLTGLPCEAEVEGEEIVEGEPSEFQEETDGGAFFAAQVVQTGPVNITHQSKFSPPANVNVPDGSLVTVRVRVFATKVPNNIANTAKGIWDSGPTNVKLDQRIDSNITVLRCPLKKTVWVVTEAVLDVNGTKYTAESRTEFDPQNPANVVVVLQLK